MTFFWDSYFVKFNCGRVMKLYDVVTVVRKLYENDNFFFLAILLKNAIHIKGTFYIQNHNHAMSEDAAIYTDKLK